MGRNACNSYLFCKKEKFIHILTQSGIFTYLYININISEISYEMLNLDFYRDNIYNTQLVNEAKRHAKNAHLRSILLSIDKSKKTLLAG